MQLSFVNELIKRHRHDLNRHFQDVVTILTLLTVLC